MEDAITDWGLFVSNFDDLLIKVKNSKQQDKLFQAKETLYKLQNSLSYHEQNESDEDKSKLQDLRLKYEKEFEMIQQIDAETQEVDRLMEEFFNNEGWTLVKESDGVNTFYRNEDGNPVHSIKIDGIVESPLFNLLAVIYEVDLYKLWWPLLKESRAVEQISKFRKVVYLRVGLPWPIWNRDTCLYGYGVDLLEKDTILITFRSCSPDVNHDHPEIPNKHVRADCKFGGMLLKIISPTKTRVIVLANADPKLAVVPFWLFNFCTKQFSPLLFSMLRKYSKELTKEYLEAVESKPEVYKEVRERIENYFKESQVSDVD